jgi:hypothetical protein
MQNRYQYSSALPSLEHLLDLIQLFLVLLMFVVKLPHHVFVVLLKDHASLSIMLVKQIIR